MRVEDIDEQRSSVESAHRQLEDLRTIGVEWDGETLYQSTRHAAYREALGRLDTYECYCSRREIQEASRAPHVLPGVYPGTCRDVGEEERVVKRAELAAQNRFHAVRLRAQVSEWGFYDRLRGHLRGEVDDFIVLRGGQEPGWAYNLAVVVDDIYQQVDQVVRGDDLLASTARQAYLCSLLGAPAPEYVHVPLVVNARGQRLAKRDGAVTLRQMLIDAPLTHVVAALAGSLGFKADTLEQLLAVFDPERVSMAPYIFEPESLTSPLSAET